MHYPIIIYGATSFTGQRATEYLAANVPQDLHWAIAWSQPHLKHRLRLDVDTLTVDAHDADGIAQLVQLIQVLITTTGPYALYGENLIKSCANKVSTMWTLQERCLGSTAIAPRLPRVAPKSSLSVDLTAYLLILRRYACEQGLGRVFDRSRC